MKKIFVSLLILAASLNAMATDFAVATLTLKGNTSLEQGEVTLVKTDDPAASSFCAPLYINQYDVVIYTINGSEKYQIWANADLTNFPLGIKTYSDASYTITVSNVSGSETLSLYDVVADQTIALTEGQTYPFTAATNSFINDRFIINYVEQVTSYTVNLNAYGMATFSAAERTVVPAGLKAYAAGNLSGTELTLTEVAGPGDYIPANTGVLLYGEQSGNPYAMTIDAGDAAAFAGNKFHAATEWTASLENVYILHGNELWQYTGTEFAPNKAYLQISMPAGTSYAPKRISMHFDAATGVENVEAVAPVEKFMQEGQVLIRRGENVYNLQGQIIK